MNETNGPGAVPPSPQPVPGSDAELRINEYFACIESRESDPLVPAAPPQESDKGRGCGQAYHDERGEVQDCEEGALCRRCLERQLAEARAEVEALREEVALTNEHEHQIMQERNELAEALLQSMGSEGGIPMTDRLNDALSACGVDYERELPPPDAAPTQAALELADLLRKRYPRLLERGNPLYDGVLAAAVERAGAADVVTVPMLMDDELYALEVRKGFYTQMVTIHLDLLVSIRRTYEYFAKTHLGLSGDMARIDDALRSSAQGGEGGAG